MAITHEWRVPSAEYTLNAGGTPDKITALFWECVAREGQTVEFLFGKVEVPPGDPISDPSSANDASVITAVKRLVGAADTEAQATARLIERTRPAVAQGPLWKYPAGVTQWQSGVDYARNDVVSFGGATWQCKSPHRSVLGEPPPQAANLWDRQRDNDIDPPNRPV